MTVRRWVTAGLLALGLGAGSASASVLDSISSGITAWQVGDIVQRYGQSRPGAMVGTSHTLTIAKAGKIIKWGGAISLTAELVNASLNWYKSQADAAFNTSGLGKWWNGTNTAFPALPEFSALADGIWNIIYNDPQTGSTFAVQNRGTGYEWLVNCGATTYYISRPWTNPKLEVVLGEYQKFQNQYMACNSSTFADLVKNDPQAASYLKNIVNQYIRSNPNNIYPTLQPVPNRNQIDDAVTDPELDTDKDGSDDGDETQTKKRNPGHRDHPDDGGPSDPNEPDSKPKDTDGDGIPDYRDGDDDNDGTPDEEEPTQPPACQKDKNCNPETEKDTDGDGQKDRDDPDDDNDGSPDQEEEEDGSDPKDPDSKPTDTDKDGTPDKKDEDDDNDGVPDEEDKNPKDPDVGRCAPGYNLGPDGNCYRLEDKPCPDGQISDGKGACIPDPKPCEEGYRKDANGNCQPKPKDCPEGQSKDESGQCKPDEDEEKCEDGSQPVEGKCGEDEEPVGDECGDLSLERAKAHLGHWVRDVVFPCESIKDMIRPLYSDLKTRFPFSVAASLNGWFQPPRSDTASSQLPAKIGPIPLDWGWLTPLWSTIKTLVGVALYVWFVYWLIDRFTPRTGI